MNINLNVMGNVVSPHDPNQMTMPRDTSLESTTVRFAPPKSSLRPQSGQRAYPRREAQLANVEFDPRVV